MDEASREFILTLGSGAVVMMGDMRWRVIALEKRGETIEVRMVAEEPNSRTLRPPPMRNMVLEEGTLRPVPPPPPTERNPPGAVTTTGGCLLPAVILANFAVAVVVQAVWAWVSGWT